MDKELAGAVLKRWDDGLPVSEMMLYKAAQALGVDPQEALTEARFQTYAGSYLRKHASLDRAHRILFSAAAGISPGVMEKTAFLHSVSQDDLIVHALQDRDWVPDLDGLRKLANLSAVGGDPTVDGQMPANMGDPAQQQAMQQALGMQQPPQQGAALQQPPGFKPSPTAPEQVPPSPQGNLDSLVQGQQQVYGQGAQENGGLPPSGMPQPPPPPSTPEERIQQVGPNLDPETISRYSDQLTRFETGINMPISDPKQMVKFVKELQKVDGKRIDQGIKAMGQQLEQEQAQELGVDGQPTIDGTGPGQQVLAPKPGASPGGGPPEDGSDPTSSAPGKPPPGGAPPKKPPAAPPGAGGKPPQPPMMAAAEKVAKAARALAHARR